MNILLINGSHRKGNTQFILETMADQIKKTSEKHISYLVNLRQKNIGFLNEKDYSCNETIGCPKCGRDDMKQLYPLLESSHLIVLASPVYFSNVSAIFKNFMDRCGSYFLNKKLKNKFALIVGVGQTQNNEEFLSSMNAFCNSLEISRRGVYYTRAEKAKDVAKDIKALETLRQFVKVTLQTLNKQMKFKK